MRVLIPAFLLLLIGLSPALGQDASELLVLRTLLDVPANTRVISSSSASLPGDEPLKVYLDVSGDTPAKDKKVRDYLSQLDAEFTKGDGTKPSTLEFVTDSSQARVALVHFTDFPSWIEDAAANVLGEINASQPNSTPLNSLKMSMIIYTYIIIREPTSLKVLYRRKDLITSKSGILMSTTQTSRLTAKLRKEIDKEIDKRATKARAQKDADLPYNELRDQFIRLVKQKT